MNISYSKLVIPFQTNLTDFRLTISDFRLNPHYVVWYRNLVSFSSTILVPFILLAYWNLSTAIIIKRRNQVSESKLLKQANLNLYLYESLQRHLKSPELCHVQSPIPERFYCRTRPILATGSVAIDYQLID